MWQVVEYLQPLLSSIEAPAVFEAARGILVLAATTEGGASPLAAAPTLAVGALVDLWDRDGSRAAHAQIMDALTRHVSALQVRLLRCQRQMCQSEACQGRRAEDAAADKC